MRRIIGIGLGLVVLAGIVLAGLWFWSRGEAEARLARAVEQAAALGWTVTYSAAEIEGFPMAGGLRMSDTALVSERGVLVEVGDLRVVADDAGGAVAELPQSMRVTIPVGGLTRRQFPILPEKIMILVEGEDMRMAFGVDGSTVLDAARLDAGIDQDDFAVKAALSAEGLSTASDFDAERRRIRLDADRFVLDFRETGGTGPAILISRYDGLTMGGSLKAQTVSGFVTGLTERVTELADLAFKSTGQEITLSVTQPGADRPQTLTWRAGEQIGAFKLDQGTLDYETEERDIRAALDLPGQETLGLAAELYARLLRLPLVTEAGKPGNGRLRISLTDVTGDDAFWQAVDPDAALGRDPARIVVDALATMRLAPGQGPTPFEFSNISLDRAEVAAAGAALSAEGDVEILQPINLPLGRIDVEATGLRRLITGLEASGWLSGDAAEAGRAILEVFARPVGAQTDDRYETDLRFNNSGLLINGRPPTAEAVAPGGAFGPRTAPLVPGGNDEKTEPDPGTPRPDEGAAPDPGTPRPDGDPVAPSGAAAPTGGTSTAPATDAVTGGDGADGTVGVGGSAGNDDTALPAPVPSTAPSPSPTPIPTPTDQ